MNQTYFNLFNQNITGKHLTIFGGSFLVLSALKYYFSGGKCRIKKDLNGKFAIITGGNAGIGKQTAIELAKQNCNLIIAARDKIRLQQTVKQIRLINPKIVVQYHQLDLGNRKSIEQFAQHINTKYAHIDYLINNAGVMMVPERRQTKDKLEMQIGINHFGHFLLTYLIFNQLKKSQQFRIINLSSKAHTRINGIDFDDLQYTKKYSDFFAYSRSKLANIYFTKILQKKITQANLNGICVSLHPGVIRSTQLTRYVPWYKLALIYLIYPIIMLITKTIKEGAQTTLYTVLEDKNKLVSGQYYMDCKVGYCTEVSKNIQMAERLWIESQKVWGVKFDV